METDARTLPRPLQLRSFNKFFAMTGGRPWTPLGLWSPDLRSKTSAAQIPPSPADPILQ